MTASVAVAAGAFSRIVHRRWPAVALWPSVAFALLAPLPVLTGTYPFLLGLALGLCALAALQEGRRKLAVALAVLTAVAHLLALLLLVTALIGVTLTIPRWWQRRSVRTMALGVRADRGRRRAPVAGVQHARWAVPVRGRGLRRGARLLYRRRAPRAGRPDLRVLLRRVRRLRGARGDRLRRLVAPRAPTSVACCCSWGRRSCSSRSRRAGSAPRGSRWRCSAARLLWQTFPAVAGLRTATEVRSSNEEFWYPVEAFLAKHGDPNHRVEVVATDHHWEAFYLARRGVPLTRGWYRQDDFPANQDLYGELTATKYSTWLRRLGVRYVFLPDDRLDYSAQEEASLLRVSQVLPEVARIGEWTVYEVPNATPIATPARDIQVREISSEEITLEASRAGSYRLRIRYTPYWQVVRGEACVAPREPWATELRVTTPGIVTLRFAVGVGKVVETVLGRDAKCADDTAAALRRALTRRPRRPPEAPVEVRVEVVDEERPEHPGDDRHEPEERARPVERQRDVTSALRPSQGQSRSFGTISRSK